MKVCSRIKRGYKCPKCSPKLKAAEEAERVRRIGYVLTRKRPLREQIDLAYVSTSGR